VETRDWISGTCNKAPFISHECNSLCGLPLAELFYTNVCTYTLEEQAQHPPPHWHTNPPGWSVSRIPSLYITVNGDHSGQCKHCARLHIAVLYGSCELPRGTSLCLPAISNTRSGSLCSIDCLCPIRRAKVEQGNSDNFTAASHPGPFENMLM